MSRTRVLAVATAAALAVTAAGAAGAVGGDAVRAVTTGTPPALHDSGDDVRLPVGRSVAHNAGNRPEATARALAAGADVVEVDVVDVDGTLRAGHDRPLPVLGGLLHRGPRIEEVWRAAAPRAQVKLDLKETGDGETAALLATLDRLTRAHPPSRPVLVTTRDPQVALAVAGSSPARRGQARAYLTLADPDAVRALRTDDRLRDRLHGVSVQHRLLDGPTVRWLRASRLDVLAWTVNEPERARALVAAGVDGVTTDDLAIVRALGER